MSDMQRTAQQFIPVVLGDRQGARAARQLYMRHGLISHLLCPRISPLRRLTPWLQCHKTPYTPAMLALALRDLAAEIEAYDRTPLLIVCDDAPIGEGAWLEELEDCYIICRDDGTSPLQYDQGGRAV